MTLFHRPVSLLPGPVILGALASLAFFQDKPYWVGGVLIALTAAVAWRAYSVRLLDGLDTAGRKNRLALRRDALANLWFWYLAPLVVGLVVYAASTRYFQVWMTPQWPRMAPFFVLSGIWLWQMGRMGKQAAEKLNQEIEEC